MSRLKILQIALLAPAFLVNALAADDALDLTAPPLGKYEVKAQSSFRVEDSTRPPFWPIGWVKRSTTAVQPEAAPVVRATLSADSFSVTSVLLGNPSLAVINGRAYGEGETVRMPKAAATGKGTPTKSGLRVQVARILDGRVLLKSADGQSLEIGLRRGQLTEKKAEAELLSEDEEQ